MPNKKSIFIHIALLSGIIALFISILLITSCGEGVNVKETNKVLESFNFKEMVEINIDTGYTQNNDHYEINTDSISVKFNATNFPIECIEQISNENLLKFFAIIPYYFYMYDEGNKYLVIIEEIINLQYDEYENIYKFSIKPTVLLKDNSDNIFYEIFNNNEDFNNKYFKGKFLIFQKKNKISQT